MEAFYWYVSYEVWLTCLLRWLQQHQANKSLTGSRHVSLQLSQVSRARGNVGSGTKGIFNSPVPPCPHPAVHFNIRPLLPLHWKWLIKGFQLINQIWLRGASGRAKINLWLTFNQRFSKKQKIKIGNWRWGVLWDWKRSGCTKINLESDPRGKDQNPTVSGRDTTWIFLMVWSKKNIFHIAKFQSSYPVREFRYLILRKILQITN